MNPNHVTPTIRVAFLAVCLFPGGCGRSGSSGIVAAGGTVTYHNRPLAGVSVTFLPEHGRPANGTTDAAGRFTLSTLRRSDGALVGRHTVSIATPLAAPMPGTREAKTTGRHGPAFPAKYSNPNSSGLSAIVEPGSPNDFQFDLTD